MASVATSEGCGKLEWDLVAYRPQLRSDVSLSRGLAWRELDERIWKKPCRRPMEESSSDPTLRFSGSCGSRTLLGKGLL
ncbi:hypothetical protein BRADI_3g10566v3 [Brachypodium distachyon]|uniref:Uncharacterized protein n=1 Tax=Brachypodium distachyon TaxID=15368 RepID=A0A0Q3F880_BRADI|nr:hypothetical protein BRADI_3g10566v3 [Brachypodium distachyon]